MVMPKKGGTGMMPRGNIYSGFSGGVQMICLGT
jgi:hypothetical protein